MAEEHGLDLLMVHADDHAPTLSGVDERATYGAAEKEEHDGPSHFADDTGDPDDLSIQRWGLIVPEGPRGERLLQLVRPLIAKRKADQGGHEPRVYRVPPEMTPAEAAVWKKKVYDDQSDLRIELPRYQLVLGDLHEVPLAIQQVQSLDGFVGRVAFSRDEDYEAYVDKVLRWEAAPAPHTQGRSIFHTVHDQTAATASGYRSLVTPGLALAQRYQEKGYFNADQVVESGDRILPSVQEFLNAAHTDRPGVMFSVSHGLGPPRRGWNGFDDRLAGQGAMSFKAETLRGEDARNAVFLPGGVWFMLACFGAGTPGGSAYWHWLKRLRDERQFRGDIDAVLAGLPGAGERPFIASLPQSVLANPNGPVAFVGHIDLAWTYSFRDMDQGGTDRPAKYIASLLSMLKGDRVGVSFGELFKSIHQTNSELAVLADAAEADRAAGRPDSSNVVQQAHLWMLRNDLRAYVLLGDPAARLAITRKDARQAVAAAPQAVVSFGAAPAVPAEELPLPIDQLEEAIAKYILGEESPKALALEYGLPRGVLADYAERYQEAGRRAIGG